MGKIRDWWKENEFMIGMVFMLITIPLIIVSTNQKETKDTADFCSEKCEELGYTYFDSEPSHFFGLKDEDCKCKDKDNKIYDIK